MFSFIAVGIQEAGRREVLSCEVAKAKGTTGILQTQQSVGFGASVAVLGRVRDWQSSGQEHSEQIASTCSVISAEGRARAKLLLEGFYPAWCRPFAESDKSSRTDRAVTGAAAGIFCLVQNRLSQAAGFPAALCSVLPRCHKRQDLCGMSRALCSARSEEPVR